MKKFPEFERRQYYLRQIGNNLEPCVISLSERPANSAPFLGFWPTAFRAIDEAVPRVHLDLKISSSRAAEPFLSLSQRLPAFGVAFGVAFFTPIHILPLYFSFAQRFSCSSLGNVEKALVKTIVLSSLSI